MPRDPRERYASIDRSPSHLTRVPSLAERMAKNPERLKKDFVRVDTSSSPRFVTDEAKKYLDQLAVIPAATAGGPRFREVQRTLDMHQVDGYKGDTTRVRVLWGMVDTKTNKLIGASVLQSGGFENGPQPGLRRDDKARGNARWDQEPILGRMGLGWLIPGAEGRLPDRKDVPHFTRRDNGGASWSMGLHPDRDLASLDHVSRSLLREHFNAGDPITNGCLTSTPEGMDVMNNARAYALGTALKPEERDEKKIIKAGLAAMDTIRAIAESSGGNEKIARARIEKKLPGVLDALPLQRDYINHALVSPKAVEALAKQWDKPAVDVAVDKKPDAVVQQAAPAKRSYIQIMTDALGR